MHGDNQKNIVAVSSDSVFPVSITTVKSPSDCSRWVLRAQRPTVHQSPVRWAEPVSSDVSVVSGTPRANVSQSSVNCGSVIAFVVAVVRPLVVSPSRYHNRWSTCTCNLKTSRLGPSHAYLFFFFVCNDHRWVDK